MAGEENEIPKSQLDEKGRGNDLYLIQLII